MTDPAPIENRRSSRWQVGLRSLILLMATIAVFLTAYVNRRESARLQERIRVMEPLAHQLKIDDPNQIAIVKLPELWTDDHRWDLYLPSGEYRVCLVTRSIDGNTLPPIQKLAPIKAGRHRLELQVPRKSEDPSIRVTLDGSELLTFNESKDWGFSLNSSGSGNFPASTQKPADQPLILFQRIFMVPQGPMSWTTPNGPADGVKVWIEPVGPG